MSNFAMLRLTDQITVVLSVLIVVMTIATMIVVGSNSLKNLFRKMFLGLLRKTESFSDKWFSDDEPFDESWMDEEAWKRTRI